DRGVERSTKRSLTRAATASRASRGPSERANSRTGVPRGRGLRLPSGKETRICSIDLLIKTAASKTRGEAVQFLDREFCADSRVVGASGFEPLTPSVSGKCSPPELRASRSSLHPAGAERGAWTGAPISAQCKRLAAKLSTDSVEEPPGSCKRSALRPLGASGIIARPYPTFAAGSAPDAYRHEPGGDGPGNPGRRPKNRAHGIQGESDSRGAALRHRHHRQRGPIGSGRIRVDAGGEGGDPGHPALHAGRPGGCRRPHEDLDPRAGSGRGRPDDYRRALRRGDRRAGDAHR